MCKAPHTQTEPNFELPTGRLGAAGRSRHACPPMVGLTRCLVTQNIDFTT
jgi:hypothetical protein